jgi:Fe-S-cluster containining protein
MCTEEKDFTKNFTKKINGLYIDPKIFTFKFSCDCSGECCNYGVYTDLKEHNTILSIKDKILSLFDESQTKDIGKWFEPPEEDEDFESGVAVGTEVNNGKCTFLDKNGLCVLQKLAMSEGEHKWKYKPIYCVLFPLTVYEGALTIDDEHIDRLETCNLLSKKNQMSIFEACTEELLYFFGQEGFAELEQYAETYLSEIKSGVEENVTK